MGGSGGSGSSGGSGGSGDSGDSGGKRHGGRKRNSVLELFKHTERKRIKYSLMSPQDKIARLGALRDQYGGDMCVQAATHMLNEPIFGVNPQAEALLEERKVEIENLINAMYGVSVLAVDQGKVLTVQIQFVQPGLSGINKECGNTKWRSILAEFGIECAVRQICQTRFFMLDSVLLPRLTYWRPTLSNVALAWHPTIPMAPSASSILLHLCLPLTCQCSALAPYSKAAPERLW